MTPPAVSAPPPAEASRTAAHAPVPQLRVRAPLGRSRHPRPGLLTGRTVAVSLVLHALMLVGVLLVPEPEKPELDILDDGQNYEAVEYLDVGSWGAMATDPSARLPDPVAAAPTDITAGAVDSVLRALPSRVLFPQRVPTGIAAPVRGTPSAAQPGTVPGAQGAQPGAGTRRSGPGGLGPELGDPRLVVTPTAIPEYIPTDEERYQEHFARRIRALNDSSIGEAERQRRANDWTFTDRNGRKWGINDRGPVIGGRNVPLPVPIPVPRSARDREDEARRERDQRRDVDRQAEQTERERYLRERGRAIREREDQEREEKGKGTTTTPPAEP